MLNSFSHSVAKYHVFFYPLFFFYCKVLGMKLASLQKMLNGVSTWDNVQNKSNGRMLQVDIDTIK